MHVHISSQYSGNNGKIYLFYILCQYRSHITYMCKHDMPYVANIVYIMLKHIYVRICNQYIANNGNIYLFHIFCQHCLNIRNVEGFWLITLLSLLSTVNNCIVII